MTTPRQQRENVRRVAMRRGLRLEKKQEGGFRLFDTALGKYLQPGDFEDLGQVTDELNMRPV